MKTKSLCWLVVLALLLAVSASACKTNKGAREFIPGTGWVPVD